MATAKVKQFWTAFVSVFVALLGALGFATPATAAQQPAVSRPEEPTASDATARRVLATVPAQVDRRAPASAAVSPAARDRSLPPTIKQRIRAEAHNATPSARHRHLRADAALETDPVDDADRDERAERAERGERALAESAATA
ncbi:DUF6344 domain-containing protein [Streptomyces sp. HUAS MG47]|uniref:DUF6344 domain-containing protein n=1 Tax=Streptomyces solicamelliae TaxID=3231716 RepID=UPI003877F7D9